MMRRNRQIGMIIGCALMVLVGVVAAQERVLPTGTPTITPRKPVATATPPPPSKTEIEARNLGEALSQIDTATWDIVGSCWREEAPCLVSVDEHLAENLGELKRLIRTSKVMECSRDKDSDRLRLRLTTEEARRAFVTAYGDAIVTLRSLREELAGNLTGSSVLEAAQQRQADWQDLACREVSNARVPRTKKQPAKVPIRSNTSGGGS